MKAYLELLSERRFGLLWIGSTISTLGDGISWTALVWLVYDITGSSAGVGALVITYTAPVVVGGLFAGMLLDRFDRRWVLILDNIVRGAFIAAIPVLYALGRLELWHIHLAAGMYGLLKMVSLAGVPSLLPSIVPADKLNTANALESISYGVGGVLGPALSGLLIGSIGAAQTIFLDAISYGVFAACLAFMPKVPLSSEELPAEAPPAGSISLRPALSFILQTPAIWAITLMFMSFNVGLGALAVLLPVYTREVLHAEAGTFGLLMSATAVGELAGSFIVGALAWPWRLGRSIAVAQSVTGISLLALAGLPAAPATGLVLGVSHFIQSPLTIWAQTIRMRLIPQSLRGRVFSLLRTLMQATPPLGGALGAALLGRGEMTQAVLVISLFIALPGLVGLVHPALARQYTGGL